MTKTNRLRITASVLLGLIGLSACADFGDDRIDNIKKLKILAVRADHPDLLPGETTQVEVLVAAPDSAPVTTFLAPAGRTAGSTFRFASGASVPSAPIDNPAVRLHVPGVSAFFYTAPVTPGAYQLVAATRRGAGEPSADDALKAVKVVRVKQPGEHLNVNPGITSLRAKSRWRLDKDGKQTSLPVRGFQVEPEEILRIAAAVTDETADRVSLVWWATGGEAQDYGRKDIDLIAPPKPALVTVVALALDREGGCDWRIQDVVVGGEELAPDVSAPFPVLVASGGRYIWLPVTTSTVRDQLSKLLSTNSHAAVRVSIREDPVARLGWLVESVAEVVTESAADQVTAGDVGPGFEGEAVLRIDGIVENAGVRARR